MAHGARSARVLRHLRRGLLDNLLPALRWLGRQAVVLGRKVLSWLRADWPGRSAILVAIGVFLGLVVVLLATGALFAPEGCGFARAFGVLGDPDDAPGARSACTALAFSADLPSQALALTSIFATAFWGWLRAAIRRFPQQLRTDAALSAKERRDAEAYLRHLFRWGSNARGVPWRKWVTLALLAAADVVLGVLFQRYAYTRNPMFGRLAAGSPSIETALQENWWAGGQADLVLRVSWVAVGCLGVFFAVRTVELYILLRKLVRTCIAPARLRYKPSALDENYGLGSFVRINDWLRACTINFSVTAIAIVFIFATDPASPWLATIPLTLLSGGIINLLANLEAYRFTKTKFIEVKRAVLVGAGSETTLDRSLRTLAPDKRDRVHAALIDDVIQSPPFPSKRQSGQVLGAVTAAASVVALALVVLRTVV